MILKMILPDSLDQVPLDKSHQIFLAGSIEMGTAGDWQTSLVQEMVKFPPGSKPVTFYNPRRDSWDSSWEQSISNPQFRYQVNWELDKLEASDTIFMYFDPKTKSPISLLELGMFASSSKMIVVCPDGFWRKGNVEIVCDRNRIELFNSIEQSLEALKRKLV